MIRGDVDRIPGMLLRIVRHGESEGNLAGTLQGARVDQPLSSRGRRQAVSLAIRLAGEGIDSVFASPMIRARETAEVVAAPHGIGVSVDPDLVEFDWGVWCGRPLTKELDQEVSVIRKRWRSGEVEAAPAAAKRPSTRAAAHRGSSHGSWRAALRRPSSSRTAGSTASSWRRSSGARSR